LNISIINGQRINIIWILISVSLNYLSHVLTITSLIWRFRPVKFLLAIGWLILLLCNRNPFCFFFIFFFWQLKFFLTILIWQLEMIILINVRSLITCKDCFSNFKLVLFLFLWLSYYIWLSRYYFNYLFFKFFLSFCRLPGQFRWVYLDFSRLSFTGGIIEIVKCYVLFSQ
jgi:hypothetical protein